MKNPLEWLLGFLIASLFSLAYILTPIYCLACPMSFFLYETWQSALLLSLPLLISILLPPMASTTIVSTWLKPMLSYFQYQESLAQSNAELLDYAQNHRKFILCFQPHGVISYVGFCAAISMPPELRPMQSAVASSLLQTPILKHLIGIFGLTNASKTNLIHQFTNQPGIHGCIVLYVGGIAELFKCSRTEERLFLSKRKGFIKLALQQNVDIVPAYLFGNTSVLSVWTWGPLAALSRRCGVALTYFWGLGGLPIPRPQEQLLYARGKPLQLPHIPEPTQADIDHWHGKYCAQVRTLYESHQDKLPHYKHKKLYID